MTALLRGIQSMSTTRRVLLLGLLAAVVCVVWLVGNWASRPTFVTLYRDLELTESANVAQNLEKANVEHRLGAGGTEILVPVADVARARVAIAKGGLPVSGRPGLELFDRPSWGMTDFTQRVTYQRALEGEMARTIRGIRGVERAQVHLVIPASRPLRSQQTSAAASVVLTLTPGTSLSRETVQGIVHIVSNSVEQLSGDHVAVMDDQGRVLTFPSNDGSLLGLSSNQLEIQSSVEEHLAAKIEDLVATVVGAGKVRAKVSARMSFDQIDQTVETFDPDGQVLQSEQRSESAEGDAAGSQNVVNNNYLNSRRLEKSVTAAGQLTHLAVAVLVDQQVVGASGTAGRVDIATLESMVRNAVGVDDARGDRVSVLAVPFEALVTPPANAGATASATGVDVMAIAERFVRPAVGVVALIVLALLGVFAVRQLASIPSPAAQSSNGAPTHRLAGDLLAQAGHSEVAMLRDRVRGVTADNPETTARVLRNWLAES